MKNTICRDGPLPPLQGQAAIELTAGEWWKWESTVSIHCSSRAPQLCHFQSIAFRKSASTLQFEMKSLFCCEAHSVYNDLTLKKHARFSEAFFTHCSKLHNMFMFRVKPEWLWGRKAAFTARAGIKVMPTYPLVWSGWKAVRSSSRIYSVTQDMWIRSSRFPPGSRCSLGPLIPICIYAYLLLLFLVLNPLPFSSQWITCWCLEQNTNARMTLIWPRRSQTTSLLFPQSDILLRYIAL